ncbi:hypothetical protein F5B20DRAFT_585614 [Whalleya microplaca]|nr:hypothetical protein F5B20DRAFT_585614 [Whalleya microplaca]
MYPAALPATWESFWKTQHAYLTKGVLIRQLSSDKNLSAYACVVIDGTYERTADIDLLLELLK